MLGQSESATLGTDPNFYSTGTTVEPLIWGELKAASLAKVSKIGALYCAEIASCAETVPLITAWARQWASPWPTPPRSPPRRAPTRPSASAPRTPVPRASRWRAASDVALRVAESCAAQGYKPAYVSTAGEMTTPWLTAASVNGAVGNTQDVPWFDDSIPATKAMQAAFASTRPAHDLAAFGATATIGWAAGTVFATVAQSSLTPSSPQTASSPRSTRSRTTRSVASPRR